MCNLLYEMVMQNARINTHNDTGRLGNDLSRCQRTHKEQQQTHSKLVSTNFVSLKWQEQEETLSDKLQRITSLVYKDATQTMKLVNL